MIDVKDIEAQANGKWHSILTSIGVPESYLTGKHGPCLFCHGEDRWRWDNKDNTGTYICNQCGSGTVFQLIMKHIGINFKEALERVSIAIGGGYVKMDSANNKNEMSMDDKKRMLNNIWTSSKNLVGGDLVCKYLHARGLVLQPDNVRFCAECYESETKTKIPAMVAKIVNTDNIPIAIHRTYLQSDVFARADIDSPKKMTPGIETLRGCSVRLFQPTDNTIIVCEGIETGIACRQIFDIGVYACLSSTILESFDPPRGIRKIIICGDRDANFTGQKSVYKLANRLYKKDYVVDVQLPIKMGTDWADELYRTIK